MNQHVTISPSQKAWNDAAKAREADRVRKANTLSIRKAAETHHTGRRLVWDRWNVQLEAHVIDRQAWIRDQAEINISPIKSYIRKRASDFGMTFDQMMCKRRFREIVKVKQLIMWEIKTKVKPAISYPELARYFGDLDHTTVMHGFNKIQAMIDNGTFDAEVEEWHRLFGKARSR